MAEIRVEQKRRSLAWLWALLAVALVGLVVWYLNNDGVEQVETVPATGAVSTPAATVAAWPAARPAVAAARG